MARAATTTDVFNAIAEPRRRQILDLLAAAGPLAVGVIVASMGLPQPAVSKHLGVLREVGLVTVEKQGKSRVYQINAAEIKAVQDWTRKFEQFWIHHMDRIKQRAEAKARQGGHRVDILAASPKEKSP